MRVSMGSHIIREGLCNSETLHWAQWQVAAFRMPLAQHMTLGWSGAPPWLSGLCHQDFMPHTEASGTKDFQTMRQEKTLACPCTADLCRKVRDTNRHFL